MIYLASPYTNTDPVFEYKKALIEEERFDAVCYAAAKLVSLGFPIFSPIIHSHPVQIRAEVHHSIQVRQLFKEGSNIWYGIDAYFMEACNSIIILTLPGWWYSKGLRIEYEYFINKGLPWARMSCGQAIGMSPFDLCFQKEDTLFKEPEDIPGGKK